MTAAVADPGAWMLLAECAGCAVPDAFMDERPARFAAREFCAHCPVLSECDRFADANRYVGLWGGVWRERRDSGYLTQRLIGIGERR